MNLSRYKRKSTLDKLSLLIKILIKKLLKLILYSSNHYYHEEIHFFKKLYFLI
jgi:hypothetical protein